MSFGKARFLVNARGRRTGVLLTMHECRRAFDELEALEAFRQQGLVWVDVDNTHSFFVEDQPRALELAPQPHPGRRIITDILEGRAKSYLTDERGKRLGAILTHRDYETTCRALEDLEDIKAGLEFDAARLRGDPETEAIPIEQVFAKLDRKRG